MAGPASRVKRKLEGRGRGKSRASLLEDATAIPLLALVFTQKHAFRASQIAAFSSQILGLQNYQRRKTQQLRYDAKKKKTLWIFS